MSIQDDDIQNDPLGEQFDLSCIEALAPILEIVQKMEPTVVKREARYLAINDLGKTVKGVDVRGKVFDGELIDFSPNLGHRGVIVLVVRGHFYGMGHTITPKTQITITGKESPNGR